MEKPDLELPGGERPRPLRYRLLAHLVPIGHGQAELRQVAIRLTQVGAVGSTEWGGRPRPRGGPCLRFRQRDEASRAVQGDRPTKALPERLPESGR